MKRSIFIHFIILLSFCNFVFSQQITIDNSLSAQQLIEDYLVKGCVEVTNITSTVNGNVNGFSSYGSFNRASSNFPFENGIVLATGNAASGGNTLITQDLNEGNLSWGTDPDYETALGTTNTHNATSIEFDFISVGNLIQFDYLLASEEYGTISICDYADSFVFLIRETASAGPYTNVALIPGTSTPVSTNSIHAEIFGFCPAENEAYFDNYDIGDTNYNGRTVVLTAGTSITPYVQYHVKLIIADGFDQNFDSAVFIQGSSLSPIINLGDNLSTCADTIVLDADLENSLATYDWYLDNVLVVDDGSPIFNVTQSGIYRVEVSVPLNGEVCIIEDEIEINISTEQTADPIADYVLCDNDGDGFETFDLTTKDAEVLASVPAANYVFTYHLSLTDAQNNVNSITTPIQNTSNPQTIHVRIEDTDVGCLAFATINLVVGSLPAIINPQPFSLCDDEIIDGYTSFDLTQIDNLITSGQAGLVVTYHLTQADADNGVNAIASPYTNTSTPSELLYVRVTNVQSGCVSTTTVEIEVVDNPIVNPDPVYIDACDLNHDGFATFDLTQAINEILQGLTNVTVTFYVDQADAESRTNPIANSTNYANIIIEEQIIYVRIEDNATGCFSIKELEIHTNLLLTGTNIQDFALCDNDGDDEVSFDLGSIAIVIINQIPGINITFYAMQTDLDNGTNPLDPLTPFVVTNSPQTLYFELTNGSCTEQAEVDLLINAFVAFTPIGSQDYCDIDDDGFVEIDLSSFDMLITGGNPEYNALYFPTEIDARNGTNVHPNLYTNVSNPEMIYARISNNITGCFDVNFFEINVIPAPTVTQPNDIIICDNDGDGFSIIDLDAKISEIVPSQTGLIIGFFTSIEDLDASTNAITNTTAHNANTQTIFVRVESIATTCYATVIFEVLVNTLPVINAINSFQLCEDDGDSTTEFLFETKDAEILNGQTDKEVFYFEDTNMTILIDKTLPYLNTISPQTIYVRVENVTDPNCFATAEFLIEVAPNPVFNIPSDFVICDDSSNDSVNEFDFNEIVTEMTQGIMPVPTITFHLTTQDAESNINPLPLNYTNVTNPQQIFVRVESEIFCSIITEFGLNILPVPQVSEAQPIQFCDADNNGITVVDLTASEFEIFDVRQNNIEAAYFETLADLDAFNNEITNPQQYTNLTNPQTIYLRVTNMSTNCYVSVPIEIIINNTPVINSIGITICDNTDNSFILSSADSQLINDTSNVTISYYATQGDADLGLNLLPDTYNYSSSNDTIHVRVEFNDTGCYTLSSFILNINPLPVANSPQTVEGCDYDHDGFLEFDLLQQNSTILGGQDPLNFAVTYHTSLTDAENSNNGLENLYNAINEEFIYARVENNTTGCFSTTEFQMIVHRKPIVDIPDIVYFCKDESLLTIIADKSFTNDTYLWSNGETTSEIEIDITVIGDYWVTVTTEFGCETTHNFSVSTSEPATIEFTTTVDFSNPNSITIDVSGIGNYVFLLDGGEPQQSNFFNDVAPGLHTVTVRDLNGCTDVTKEVFVIDVPLFMTPNGDGYFDTWHVIGIEQLPGTIVYIFDRYGKLLKTLSHTSQGWNGTFNGYMMPATDYWFLADVKKNNTQFEFRGHFTLRR